MTKRKLLAIFFALALGVSMTGCGNKSESGIESDSKTIKETVSQQPALIFVSQTKLPELSNTSCCVFYDPETLVMYVSLGYSALTRMDNPDGTPKLYSPDSKTE